MEGIQVFAFTVTSMLWCGFAFSQTTRVDHHPTEEKAIHEACPERNAFGSRVSAGYRFDPKLGYITRCLSVEEGKAAVAEEKAIQEGSKLARLNNITVASDGGQAVKSYALPGNTSTGAMPNMAVGGVTTFQTFPSNTENPIKAIVTGAGQSIREMNNKQVAAGLFVPPRTSCGNFNSLRNALASILLQVDEVERSFLEGISFYPACQAHDACYGNCQKKTRDEDDKEACDNEFKQLMTAICDKVTNKIRRSSCLNNRDLYYSAVKKLGKSAYIEAKKACIATPPLQQASP